MADKRGPLALIIISPSIMKIDPPGVAASARHLIQHPPIFPLENPGILSIPLGFLAAILGTLFSREPAAENYPPVRLQRDCSYITADYVRVEAGL